MTYKIRNSALLEQHDTLHDFPRVGICGSIYNRSL